MFTDMEKWAEIRRLVKVEERSKRSVCRQFGIHWDTLVKILEHTEPPGYRQAQPRVKRKIGPFLEIIDQILEAHKKVHRKQHHTARRIFDRLKDEYGYPGGYTAVKEIVRDRRLRHWGNPGSTDPSMPYHRVQRRKLSSQGRQTTTIDSKA